MTRPTPPADSFRFHTRPVVGALCALWRSPRSWSVLAGTLPGLALAGPSGEQIVAGDVAVTRPDGNHTLIQQDSDKAILNWQQFSIAGHEYVQFSQPGHHAIALNRVVGGDVSNILGSLTANGQVFLVNPQGVYFGPHASVDVGGLVASILDIRDDDFLAGRYVFSRHPDSPPGAAVVNDGYIRAREGGYVVLAGDYTGNTGVVEARLGEVVLASGSRMTLDIAGDGLVSFAVDEATLAALAGVENSGQLLADGGRVVMTAEVAADLMGAAVNNAGLVQARGISEQGGEIWLTAEGGDVVNSGRLDADAVDGGDGGAVRVFGDRRVDLAAGGVISARGDGGGSGGYVRVVADERLAFRLDHTIDVRGGEPNQGGFVEVSGHGSLRLAGTLRLGGGELVIDPDRIIIRDGAAPASPQGGFGSTGTTEISETYLEGLLAGSSYGSGADITLVASQSIEMDALTDGELNGTNPNPSLYRGGDLRLFIGSASGGGGNPSYGVFQDAYGLSLNSTDTTASIVLNADVRVDGDFIAVTGNDGLGNGIGTITLRDVTAGVNPDSNGAVIAVGASSSDDALPRAASVTTGHLDLVNADGSGDGIGAGGVRVNAENTITAGNISVATTIDTLPARVSVGGGTHPDITLGDVTATAGGGASGGQASILIEGGSVTTGGLSAEGFGGSPSTGAWIQVSGNGGAVSVGNVSATANNGHDALTRVNGTGAVTVGNVAVSGLRGSASLGGSGAVTVGDVAVSGSNGYADANVWNTTTDTVTVGNVTVTGNGGFGSLELWGSGDVTAGAVTVMGVGGRGEVNIWGSGAGTVAVSGIDASGSYGSVNVWGYAGPVDVGNVTATGASGRGEVNIWGGSGGAPVDVTVGNVAVSGSLGSVNLWGSGGGDVNAGDVAATGSTGRGDIDIWSNGPGTVTVGNLTASGDSSASVHLWGYGGAFSAGDVVAGAAGQGNALVRLDAALGATPGDVVTGRLSAAAPNAASIQLEGRDVTTEDLALTGSLRNLQVTGRDVRVAAAAGIGLGSSGAVTASRSLTMVAAQGSITNSANFMIQADALALAAPNGSILLPNTRIYVGDGIATDTNGNPLLADAELINTLQQNAGEIFAGAEAASPSINALFQAGDRLELGSVPVGDPNDYQLSGGSVTDGVNFATGYLALQLGIGTDIDGDGVLDEGNRPGYVWLEGGDIDLGPVVGEKANIIVQWATPNDLVIADALPATPDTTKTYLTVQDHFSRFGGTTHAPGFSAHPLSTATPLPPGIPTGPYLGNVDITGTVNLGSANFFLLTGGSTTGLENIQTTGLVGLIAVVATPTEPGSTTTEDLLSAVDAEEGELDDLTDESSDVDDPDNPDRTTKGDEALARVCQ